MTMVLNGTTGISPVSAAGTSASIDGMTVGRGAGEVSTNTAVGASALAANTSGSNNTVVGYQAGYTNTTGINRTSVGSLAGYSGTAATSSTCIGYYAGYSTTGTDNTLIGAGAGYQITTGTKNTVLGEYTGNQGGLDIRTASNYIVLSDGDGNPRGYFGPTGTFVVSGTPSVHVFYRQTTTAAVSIGEWDSDNHGTNTTAAYIRVDGGLANYSANNTNLSDARAKTDIKDAGSYLAKICAIPVRTFKYKNVENAEENLGVIAQEVEAIAPELVDASGWGKEVPEDGIPLKAIYQTDLQYALMKAIQELKAEFDAYKATHP